MRRPVYDFRRVSAGSRIWLLLTALLFAIGTATLISASDVPQEKNAALPVFDLQGHRGARGLYPENSLAGFEAALALGVTTLEMDIGLTRDGVLVVHHGRGLDPERTRGPGGAWLEPPAPLLIELDFAALAAYDLGALRPGSRAAERFPHQATLQGVAVPSLDQVLVRAEELSGGRVRYNVETKISPLAPKESAEPEDFARRLIASLRRAGVAGRATIQSFDWRTLRHVQEMAPEIPTAYLTAERSWLDNLERGRPGTSPWTAGVDLDEFGGSAPRAVVEAGGRTWSPYFRDLREADLGEAHRLGLKVVVWTVNEPADMASLIDLGVDGIITDYPDRARKVLAEKGLALPPAFPGSP